MPPWWAMNDYNRCVAEYVLVRGRADVTVGDIIVERAEAGTILGELALIGQVPRSATATAAIDCQFLPIDAKRFQFLVQQTPHFALHVMKLMADRLRRTDALLLEASANKSANKQEKPTGR